MSGTADDVPLSGSIPVAAGGASVVRIPIPGAHRLAVELRPRDPHFKGNTSSTLFIQDITGKKKLLRLDYGMNKVTGAIDYHWNQKGVYDQFRIAGHSSAGRAGAVAYHGARAYRAVGGVLLVVGVAIDVISVVQADQPIRRASQAVTGWALAWAGCKGGGYVGGAIGTAIEPGLGTAGGAILGCIVGGYGGYRAGEVVGDAVYQWAANTRFTRLPEAPVPVP